MLENQPCQRLEIPGSSRRAGEKGIEPDSDLHPKVDLLSAASDGLGREGAVLACHQVERTARARSVHPVPQLTLLTTPPAQGLSILSATSARSRHLWRSPFAPIGCLSHTLLEF